jgi:hypothetical protein
MAGHPVVDFSSAKLVSGQQRTKWGKCNHHNKEATVTVTLCSFAYTKLKTQCNSKQCKNTRFCDL